MIYGAKAREYRFLAQRYLEEGSADRVIACLARALELDPSGDRPQIDRLLKEVAARPLGETPAAPSAELQRLDRRRHKLDALVAEERKISPLPPVPPAQPATKSEMAVPANLARELHRIVRLVRDEPESPAGKIRGRLELLLKRLCPGGPPPLDEPDGDDPFDRWLSVEHRLHNLANDFYKESRFEDAIGCYDLVLELDGSLLESYFNRGLAHTRACKYEKAEGDLTKVIELNPNLAEAFYTRGLIREYQEELETAIEDYGKALEVDPDYSRARTQLEAARRKRVEHASGDRKFSGSSEEEGQIHDFSPYLVRPDCRLRDVGGHHRAKRRMQTIVAYLRGDPAFDEWGVAPPRGVLLCGRPGVGKTHLARALAGEVHCPFYAPPTSVFEDMYAGNTQKNLRTFWEEAAGHEKAIIFLDEFDSIAQNRAGHRRTGDYWYNRIIGCLLELMDNLANRSGRLVVVAATNCREDVDKAFLRPGRFSYVIEVDAPTAAELAEIWLIHVEAAAEHAKRVDFMTPGLAEAVYANRQDWLGRALQSGAIDTSGVLRLARRSDGKGLVGDDVREIVRRTVEERAMAAIECGVDLGPIGPDDLYRQLESYRPDGEED